MYEKEIKLYVDKQSIFKVTQLVNYKEPVEISLSYSLLPFSDVCITLSLYLKLQKGLCEPQKAVCATLVFNSRVTRSQDPSNAFKRFMKGS